MNVQHKNITKVIAFVASLALAPVTFAQQGSSGKQKSKSQSQILKQEQAVGQGVAFTVSPSQIRQIQQALNEKGFDVGKVDGRWGPSTKKSMKNFQQSVGLEPTGMPNSPTLSQLNVNIFSASGMQRSPASVEQQQQRQQDQQMQRDPAGQQPSIDQQQQQEQQPGIEQGQDNQDM